MKGQENNLEGLMAKALGFIQAGTGKNSPFLTHCFYWVLYGQAPIYY
jgi:hypothetical protein